MNRIKAMYRKLSLARKISLLSIIVITCVMISFTIIVRIFYEKSVVEIASNGYAEKFEAVSENCRSLFIEAEQISKVICTDEAVQEWFDCDKIDGMAWYVTRLLKAEQQLDYVDALYPREHFSISIFSMNGDMLNTNNIRSQKKIYQKFFSEISGQTARIRWIDLFELQIEGYEGGGIAFVRPYKDYATGKVRGYIMIEYSEDILAKNFSGLRYGELGQYVIADREGNVKLFSDENTGEDILGEEFFSYAAGKEKGNNIYNYRGEKYIVTASNISTIDWIMIGLTPVKSLTQEADTMIRLVYVIGIAAMLISAFFNYYIAHSVTKPLLRLTETMERFGKGELEIRVPVNPDDEIGKLANNFNNMTVQISHLINQVYEEQRMKRKFEISVLQAQINPHFLYNTLNSVCSLIKVGKPEGAYSMVHAIGQFYRTALSNGSILIPIKDEIENVKNYIKIQKIRYGEKITYDIVIDKKIYKYYIVKLTLQPIVENAIYHGIKEINGTGNISLRGYLKENRIIFEIKDNGAGMDPDKAEQLLKGERKHRQTAFGLYSIHQRIQLYFGKEYGVEIYSRRREGVTAVISIPCVSEGEYTEC